MAYTYESLKNRTVAELREIAQGIQSEHVQGHSQMNKEHLLPALCKALGIDMREHHSVTGIDKGTFKSQIRELKRRRAAALDSHDHATLKGIRRQIHRLNRQLRAHMS
jgi:hypothetical protein